MSDDHARYHPEDGQVGPAAFVPDEVVASSARLVQRGRRVSLAAIRYRGMPLFPGHPPLEVVSYRTSRGLRANRDRPWGPHNDAELGYMSELVSGTMHTGAHIDALAHMTIGDTSRWYGGGNEADHLGDFGPTFGDGSKLPALVTRGVLLDVAAARGVDCLPAGTAISADELREVAAEQDTEVRRWDTVLVRTGYMSFWPDADAMARHRGAGPDLSAATWLSGLGVVATGSDTETFEVQPAPDLGEPSNPQPVHTHLLIENGVYIMESLDLEELSRERIHEFMFVALPLKIRGTTGSMIDPIAMC